MIRGETSEPGPFIFRDRVFICLIAPCLSTPIGGVKPLGKLCAVPAQQLSGKVANCRRKLKGDAHELHEVVAAVAVAVAAVVVALAQSSGGLDAQVGQPGSDPVGHLHRPPVTQRVMETAHDI